MSLTLLAACLVALPACVVLYAYAGYPLLLRIGARIRRPAAELGDRRNGSSLPTVSVCIPAYNEGGAIAETLERVLALDYPRDRLQVLVVSDASADDTDNIVRQFEDRGVELLSLSSRHGKTSAQEAALPHLRGELIVNLDASTKLYPGSLLALVAPFRDPSVGVASGRDVSIGAEEDASLGESGYVGYEMGIRSLETELGGLVGASGCFYATRRELFVRGLPGHCARDFATVLSARDRGYRAVSAEDALCGVSRSTDLSREYRRKVRTMARGLATLWRYRRLLNPLRSGRFAWMLASHKLARWLVSPLLLLAAVGLAGTAAGGSRPALAAFVVGAAGALVGAGGWAFPRAASRWRAVGYLSYGLVAVAAGVVAWWRALGRHAAATWEPTARTSEKARDGSSDRRAKLSKDGEITVRERPSG